MFKKSSILNNNKSLKDNLSTQISIKSNFHETPLLKAKVETSHDKITFGSFNKAGKETLWTSATQQKIIPDNIKKSEEIKQSITDATVKPDINIAYNRAFNTFKMALKHYCFYDFIDKKTEEVTIIFLPISTSNNRLLCGIQRFEKIHTYSNELKSFYITRLLFQKTMTWSDYNIWVNKTKEGDAKVRKIIFDCVQQDLDNNSYSILKDTDILQPNIEFFSKELPLIKYKFTDLEF